MKARVQVLVGSMAAIATLLVQAGNWDNFRLRSASLSQYINPQNRELDDLRQQNIALAQNSRIHLVHLLNGGPPKDGIPSIDRPQFDTATTTPFDANTAVIGVVINGNAKAYPLYILNWHEIVNDTLGSVNISISYCPLCDTMLAIERGNTTFGVTGKLYQSCLVMYDRADDTLYAQPWALGIVGNQVNASLKRLPTRKTTLGAWLAKHPNSQILAARTGHNRDYFSYPYGTYDTDTNLIFPVRNQNQRRLHPKAIVSYIWEPDSATPKDRFSGASMQFPHQQIAQMGQNVVRFNGRQIRARWDQQLQTVRVEELDGQPIPSTTAFAFVYPAFFGQ